MLINGTKILLTGMWRMPLPWKAWVLWLFIVNAVVPLFFLHEWLAAVTLIAFVPSPIIGGILADKTGFSRLLGLMHVAWLVYIPYVFFHMGKITDNLYVNCIYVTILTNGLSLIFDVSDVLRYLRGERKPIFNTSTQSAN
jgi:hypothetical protein